MKMGFCTIGVFVLLTNITFAQSYDYPLKNPYFATAIGTPSELEYPTNEISYPNIEKL